MGKKFTGEDKLLQELNRLVREINVRESKQERLTKVICEIFCVSTGGNITVRKSAILKVSTFGHMRRI